MRAGFSYQEMRDLLMCSGYTVEVIFHPSHHQPRDQQDFLGFIHQQVIVRYGTDGEAWVECHTLAEKAMTNILDRMTMT
jgi:hypothetical protein